MIIVDNKGKSDLPIHDVIDRYAFLNSKTESNDSFEMINMLIVPQACQARERKDYDCKKANYGAEMISKKDSRKVTIAW